MTQENTASEKPTQNTLVTKQIKSPYSYPISRREELITITEDLNREEDWRIRPLPLPPKDELKAMRLMKLRAFRALGLLPDTSPVQSSEKE